MRMVSVDLHRVQTDLSQVKYPADQVGLANIISYAHKRCKESYLLMLHNSHRNEIYDKEYHDKWAPRKLIMRSLTENLLHPAVT